MRLEAVVDDFVKAMDTYAVCGPCAEERTCPECGSFGATGPVEEALDAVREEIDRQVELFNLAS